MQIPMANINKEGKLYKRYVYESILSLDSEGENVGLDYVVQFANFVNYKKFKWLQESKTEFGKYKVDGRLISGASSMYIRTNSQESIEQYDIVEIESQYYFVIEPVEQEYVNLPKRTLSLQHLKLESINFEKANIAQFIRDISKSR